MSRGRTRRVSGAISITARVTCLFALIASVAVCAVGMSFYDATRAALAKRADYQLIARVEHMRALLHDLYTVQQIETRPALFETMLGDEQDVIVFRRPGVPPFIDVNPEHVPLPAFTPVPANRAVTLGALREGRRGDGVRTRWLAANAQIGGHGENVEIVAAHVMTQEERVLRVYRARVFWTIAGAVLAAALCGFWALRRGLSPLREMAGRAAEITPERLSTRLDIAASPPELRQLAHSFNDMLDRLATGYHRLVQFSADLAHELRTPIGVLIGQTQVTLVHARSAAEYRSVLESNLEELEHLARIAQNILFLAQADHETQRIERTTLDIGDELDTIQTYFEGLADERGLRFALHAAGTMRAHPVMCRRAISNVVVNAVRYALPNTTITLSGEDTSEGAVITVGNQAEPIPADQLERLFDRFYRGDDSRSAFTESSGLGLAIVRAILTLHGGSATIDCTPRGWITVRMVFPWPAAA
ncbi:heavy metal sensor histidine kinase [Robbsia sp. Bb-Pol-6]|uniref:Sensor protein n=1 Tax=Robbsia betulipollinis TaxID=2981849 RepID=A0ABT3ZHI8_9BURK|nr:heavy metal sensor histidine kinase [Robbsia betulipollinis]MCY0385817.1 heavy metal sensor histidine kinase [Robbsia betulipollinis]